MSETVLSARSTGDIVGTDVEVEELGTATYDDVQDYINFFGDRTLLSGGGITDNSNGTATVAAGTAWAKVTDSDTAVGEFFDFAADNSVGLTDLITNYLYLDYNGGTPQIVVSTSITTHGFKQDHIHIATIFRNGTTLHFHEEDAIGIGRVNIVDMRLLEMHDADRASGLVTSDGGSLALSITTGVIYEGLSRHATIVDGSTWSTWYYDGDLGTPAWVEVTGQSTIDNANYNNVATGLASLTSNRYAVHWIYCDIDGENLHIVYGQGDYTINQAEEAGVPASLPDIAVHYGVLIAKIVVQEGQTSLEILYPWTTTFHSSLATDHGSLAGLADDDHPQYVLITDLEDTPTEDEANKATTSEYIFDHNANVDAHHAQAHKDTHDPNDGGDALDTANAAEISVVVGAGTGTSHSLARADHVHAINHAITDNHLTTVDGSPNSAEMTVWTANGLDGKTYAEMFALLFSIAIPEQIAFTLDDALSADGKYCITTALNGTAGEQIDFGEAVYFKAADSKWWLGKGDAEATLKPMTGLVIVAGAAEAAVKIALIGEVRADAAFPALTIGAPVFISAATAGAVTTTALTTGQFQKAIGWAKTANVVVLTGNPDWVEVE